MKNRNNMLPWIAVLLLIIIGTMDSLVRFATDYLWFNEMGYVGAFLIRLLTYMKLGGPVLLISGLVFYFYLQALRKRYFSVTGITPEKATQKKIGTMLNIGAVVLGAFYSIIFVGSLWFDWLSFINRTAFGKADPLFGMDISFYFFVLPLLKRFLGMGLVLLFILAVLTVLFMLMLANVRPKAADDHVYDLNEFRLRHDIRSVLSRNIFSNAIIKIGILGSLALILIAFTNVISVYDLVYSPRGVAYGASYTDVTVSLPGYWLMAAVALVGAALFLFGAVKRRWRFMIIGPAVLLIAAVGISLAEVAVQNFLVSPDERAKERPYIVHNIAGTQDAFQLDEIETLEYPADDSLTKDDLADNADIIKNIRINDYSPLKMTINQLQGIRLYYEFNDVDIDRYVIDGEERQVFIAAREMNQEKLDQRTWVNTHLQFTHGYGVALSPVNEVTAEGQPVLMVKDIPPSTQKPELKVTRPEIYFGEFTNNYIIVNAREKEFDYPKGSDNVYVNYEGAAGIPLNFVNRVLFSVREKTLNPLISDALQADSRIILNRNVLGRAKTIMPWLHYDEDPYIVINQKDGKLYWLIDAYTVSNRYPYSQPHANGINYIRNSVKVIVDAYSGEINYYIYDETDPMVKTYQKIFPDMFKSAAEIPAGLAEHVRYPEGLLDIQADLYKRYHVSNPDVFYNGEDIWDIAQEKYMKEQTQVEANYVMFRLPGEDEMEFILNIPFTPKDKSNMNALMMARNDGADYGKLFVYQFPKDKLVQGPQMLESRIDQDTFISQQLSLWNRVGSSVLRGNLMAIHIKNSILYVEPIYLQSSGERSLPEMKRVVVSYGVQVVMEETLQKCLDRIFGTETAGTPAAPAAPQTPGSGTVTVPGEAQALVEQARSLIDSSVQSIEQLKQVLDQLTQIVNQAQPAPPAPVEPAPAPQQ